MIAPANFSASFFTGSRGRSARQFFGKLSPSPAEDGALANFLATSSAGPAEDGALANFLATFSAAPAEEERSPVFRHAWLQVPQRTERSHFFLRKKKHGKGEQYTALSLKRENGHRRRGYVRRNVGFSTALIGRCVFLEIC